MAFGMLLSFIIFVSGHFVILGTIGTVLTKLMVKVWISGLLGILYTLLAA